jgi:hypothetical protein
MKSHIMARPVFRNTLERFVWLFEKHAISDDYHDGCRLLKFEFFGVGSKSGVKIRFGSPECLETSDEYEQP